MTYSAVINKQRHYLSIMNVTWKQLEASHYYGIYDKKTKHECSISREMRKHFLPILYYLSDFTQLITWSILVWFTFIQSVNALQMSNIGRPLSYDPLIYTCTMASLNKQ